MANLTTSRMCGSSSTTRISCSLAIVPIPGGAGCHGHAQRLPNNIRRYYSLAGICATGKCLHRHPFAPFLHKHATNSPLYRLSRVKQCRYTPSIHSGNVSAFFGKGGVIHERHGTTGSNYSGSRPHAGGTGRSSAESDTVG